MKTTANYTLELFKRHTGPHSIKEVHQLAMVNRPSVAFSTIFRQIKRLEREKKIIAIDWRERGGKFELANLPHHHHLSCTVCGKVVDIDNQLLAIDLKKLSHSTHFKITDHHIEIKGVCETCQKGSHTMQA